MIPVEVTYAITSNFAAFAAETAGPREQSRTVVASVECENHRHVRVLPAPDRVPQPKGLTQIRLPKGSIRPPGAVLFGMRSRMRPRTVIPRTLMRLLLS